MKINQTVEVKIEKMLYEGKALARFENFPIFIDNACTNDVLKVKIEKINKNYAIASIVEIITPSKYRVMPVCSMHNVCGSCNWQYINYDRQLVEKQNIVCETIKHIAGIELNVNKTVKSPKTTEYRCKIQYPIAETKVSKRILAGYYKKNSHELINIKYCPMQDKHISEILDFIRAEAQKLKISAYDEKSHKGILRHVIFRESSDFKSILVIFVINSNNVTKEIKKLAEIIKSAFNKIVGVCANFNTKKSNVIMGDKTVSITGDDYYIEDLSGIRYKVSANSFFQVNPYCAELIFNEVKSFIELTTNNKPTILDAYSGVSSFGIWLSPIAKKVISIEEVPQATQNAEINKEMNNVTNLEIMTGDASVNFEKLITIGTKFDISLIDPPRKGCSEGALNNLVQLTENYIIYVSCNVSTLARDMKKLNELRFEPIIVKPFDMFPNTYHIETMAVFKRKR